jgi:galactokinase
LPPVTVQDSADRIAARFTARFGGAPRVYRAPGRVNLIGDHTDYNEGFVMPVAIDLSTWVAAGRRPDRRLVVHSENLADTAETSFDRPLQPRRTWSDYVFGVAAELAAAGMPVAGANILVHSEVPCGGGLSSSAALEVATGFALLDIAGQAIDLTALALLCQRAENTFVGARCGIMDQFAACHGTRDGALMLDCRLLQSRTLPLPSEVRVVVCNSMVKHAIAAGEYNARRAECEAAVQALASQNPDIHALRDVMPDDLARHGSSLPPVLLRRARHVVLENQRVIDAADALERLDLARCGRLMQASHASLRDDFSVSCRELDELVEVASRLPGVYGSRMTGGGFGGCTVSLVATADSGAFGAGISDGYVQATGRSPDVHVCSPAHGVERVRLTA